jgi:hypothetical protein
MNTRLAFRRFASFAFVIAMFALTANSTFAQVVDPGAEFIIIVGG